jgi:putative transposase
VRYSQRLDDNNIVASVGSNGDSFDNAMAESFNGLYKWELIYAKGPWSGLEDVEFATLTYVDWFNHRRLHGEIEDGPGYTTPAAFEAQWREANARATLYGDVSLSDDTVGTNHHHESTSARHSPNQRASMKPGAVHVVLPFGPAVSPSGRARRCGFATRTVRRS